MKNLLLIILVFTSIPSLISQKKSLNFVDKKYTLPKGCKKVSDYEFKCDQFEMSWLIMPKTQIENVLFDQIRAMEKKSPDFKYIPVRLLIEDQPASGFLVSFTADYLKYFALYAAGTIRGKNVLIQALDQKPFWKFDGPNEVYTSIITILPDINKTKASMDQDLPENQPPTYFEEPGRIDPPTHLNEEHENGEQH